MSDEVLIAWLRHAHDDGDRELRVRIPDVGRPLVTRADGSRLSHTEEIEVRAILAAHAAEPLEVGP